MYLYRYRWTGTRYPIKWLSLYLFRFYWNTSSNALDGTRIFFCN